MDQLKALSCFTSLLACLFSTDGNDFTVWAFFQKKEHLLLEHFWLAQAKSCLGLGAAGEVDWRPGHHVLCTWVLAAAGRSCQCPNPNEVFEDTDQIGNAGGRQTGNVEERNVSLLFHLMLK
ncbi:hypothetical protein Y1Q_0020883 [Alligator mississippiensis]|uniref:Secreted protein n=1 Tax=Alligator mississippiensis TaxID=8496 RepID=A0A151NJ84_ALLMI|nr:hypothetical protein Y1Q_0020883 [Alligator mississippiensis]